MENMSHTHMRLPEFGYAMHDFLFFLALPSCDGLNLDGLLLTWTDPLTPKHPQMRTASPSRPPEGHSTSSCQPWYYHTHTFLANTDQDSVRLLAVESCSSFAVTLSREDTIRQLLPVVLKFSQVRRVTTDALRPNARQPYLNPGLLCLGRAPRFCFF